MPTAFVAGATGYTGREVVRALVARGVRTIAHIRPDSPRVLEVEREFVSEGATVDVTPWDEDAFVATLSAVRPDLVFALLGTTRHRERAARAAGGPAASYESVDYALTVLLLRAVLRSGHEPRFVYLSALGTSGSSRSAYYAARRKTEAAIVESGVPYLIARPSLITGPDRAEHRAGERLAAVVSDSTLGLLARLGVQGPRDRYASMTAVELGSGLVALSLLAEGRAVIAEARELRAAAP